jgi:hypothetical protein
MRTLAVLAVALLAAGTVAAGAAGCRGGRPAAPQELVIAAGGPDDVYRVLGDAFAEAARRQWSAQVEVAATGGAVENLQLVAEGLADVGFATLEAAAEARSGAEPFTGALPVVALARLYEDYLQVVTLAGNTEIDDLGDLAGRRVSIGTAGSGTDIAAARVLFARGVSPASQVELDARASARALLDGEIDAFFVAGGLPTPAVVDLAGQAPVKLLGLPDVVGELQDQYGEYYLARSIPVGAYDLDAEVETVGIPNVLVVRQDLPEQTAYRLTELLFDAKPDLVAAHEEARRLDHRSALATFPIELHPGALRYYRDQKPLVEA